MSAQDLNAWAPGPNGFDIRGWLAQLPRYGWTATMIRQLPEQFRFEIIDGELLLPLEWWDDEPGSGDREEPAPGE